MKQLLLGELRPFFQARKFQAYCVGTAKSGTHSIAAIFENRYSSKHESENDEFVELIFDLNSKNSNRSRKEKELVNYVQKYDRKTWLELNSSSVNYFLIDILVDNFPKSQFILTIRDCCSWIDSFINHQLSRSCPPKWKKLRALRFEASEFKHDEKEKSLLDRGLYSLDAYFSHWKKHNDKVLAAVPEDRLLIVRTHEIQRSIPQIADFLKIPPATLNSKASHSFKAKEKFNILNEIDKEFLEEKLDFYCKDLMTRFFPEFESVQDYVNFQKLRSGL